MTAFRLFLVLVLVAAMLLAAPRRGGGPQADVTGSLAGALPWPAADPVPPSGLRPATQLPDLPGRLPALLDTGSSASGPVRPTDVLSASSSTTQPAGQHTCTASWFGEELRGAVMASGVPFDPDELVAARWDVPFGTRYRVTAATTGRTVEVTVADRGPARRLGRCIDLSAAAFSAVADPDVGLIQVYLEELP